MFVLFFSWGTLQKTSSSENLNNMLREVGEVGETQNGFFIFLDPQNLDTKGGSC